MNHGYISILKNRPISGTAQLVGAKNAVLVIIASLILTKGKSVLHNVPQNADVLQMMRLLEELGADVSFDIEKKQLTVDTSDLNRYAIQPEMMNKMRASILVMGPLLARFGKANIAAPGGCVLGARPINYHLVGFKKLGVTVEEQGLFLLARVDQKTTRTRIVFEYPSVGATENIMMFAALGHGELVIVNAAIEPEVLDLIDVLKKMGAKIDVLPGATIHIQGVQSLHPVVHSIIPDRLEAGALLLATAITGGTITLTNARPDHMDIFLEKLREMGHDVITSAPSSLVTLLPGITLKATDHPRAVDIKTGPYPAFPTDLQAPMMAALCLADGTSNVEETVFENRMMHVKELQKMGAQIVADNTKATIRGVDELYGCEVIASDIRASCALVLAGMTALGPTKITGIHHWRRGYDNLDEKLNVLGATIQVCDI